MVRIDDEIAFGTVFAHPTRSNCDLPDYWLMVDDLPTLPDGMRSRSVAYGQSHYILK
ncbi:hypothetical protein [Moorena sp. SIO3H5]|uniref:hypothetical protein n=1 Tax=Moorena sp. SIO3H5 TaxID=2607834 RepID=UPI0013BD72EE|nr:hypothetical protein [Moorena sp. SIO3H5]NEO72037.1 hypothetical protein [Moorena sp. SIO3H5]